MLPFSPAVINSISASRPPHMRPKQAMCGQRRGNELQQLFKRPKDLDLVTGAMVKMHRPPHSLVRRLFLVMILRCTRMKPTKASRNGGMGSITMKWHSRRIQCILLWLLISMMVFNFNACAATFRKNKSCARREERGSIISAPCVEDVVDYLKGIYHILPVNLLPSSYVSLAGTVQPLCIRQSREPQP